eukprot:1664418-Rhodomonas_salina.1
MMSGSHLSGGTSRPDPSHDAHGRRRSVTRASLSPRAAWLSASVRLSQESLAAAVTAPAQAGSAHWQLRAAPGRGPAAGLRVGVPGPRDRLPGLCGKPRRPRGGLRA